MEYMLTHKQEIVGIGGNLKKKLKKKELVGAVVKEYVRPPHSVRC